MNDKLGRVEEWFETCARVCQGLVDLGGKFTWRELQYLYETMFYLRGCVSGRALWQLGTDTVKNIGADSLQNCWHVAVNDVSAFTFTFNQLMLGGGVGFNVLPQYVYELPEISFNPPISRVNTHDCDLIVPDNREGWVELLDRILEAFYFTGKPLHYNTQCVRPKGAPIRGFGGTASGPEDLVMGMKNIVRILRSRYQNKLRPIDAMDIMNIIGEIVVSGNVRRSSEITLGDPHDFLYLNAKNWGLHQIPNWRTMSNNSIAANKYDDILPQFWISGYTPNLDGEMEGEPYGLVNLNNCRRYGRLIDGSDANNDPDVVGVNPCAEITLANKEGCNLAEIFLPNIRSEQEFKDVAGILFKGCKTISNGGFSDPETDAIVKKNHRIGIGLTGYMQAHQYHDGQLLDRVYEHLIDVDRTYSKVLGIKRSIKLTTMKPSGTLSLLPGVTPGMHAAISKYMFRTVRMSANHPLVQVCRDHGYHVEPKIELDGTHNHDTMVVYFPVETPDGATLAEDLDVIEELEVQKHLQTYWADNSVSATHYFETDDVPRIKEWLSENYDDSVKSTSFLLRLGHGFKQAPFQPITKERYEEAVANVRPITSALIEEGWDDVDDALECASGHCPVK
jgi:ribonucleoside-triphosphate reductase